MPALLRGLLLWRSFGKGVSFSDYLLSRWACIIHSFSVLFIVRHSIYLPSDNKRQSTC